MDISLVLAEASTMKLFASAVWYTLIYAALIFVPLRLAILLIVRHQSASARRKADALARKARRLRTSEAR